MMPPIAWADAVGAAGPTSTPNGTSGSVMASTEAPRPTLSSYIPPHLRNRGGGGGAVLSFPSEQAAAPLPFFSKQQPTTTWEGSRESAWGNRDSGGGVGNNVNNNGWNNNNRGDGGKSRGDYSPSNISNGWGGGSGSGWGGAGGRGRDRELNPFENSEESLQGLSKEDNTVINFDAYEDIPVEVSGDNIPEAVNSFAEINLGVILNENIKMCKYVKPTPVQKHAIPISLSGRDLMACAQTGSGKTAAFCFPIIAGILQIPSAQRPPRGLRKAHPLALIMSPTRELSCQINDEVKKFAYRTGLKVVVAYGGAPVNQQLKELERGVDILVATPGRLNDLLERARISLSMIRYLALDEADRMLDMGFEPQIRKIVNETDMPGPGVRQTMLFSATFPREIQRLASDFLSNYIFLAVGRVGSSTDLIVQKVEYVQDNDKRSMLVDLIHGQNANRNLTQPPLLTLVFVETKRGADSLENFLCHMGFPATTIHGDRSQQEREHALRSFRTGRTPILVATDVAARGLDIPHVAHVVNFDLPNDIDDYVHRIGRTGRAGKKGIATAFFNDSNMSLAKPLAGLMVESNQEVPDWLHQLASRASFGGGGRNRRFGGGGGSRFGGRDFRREGRRGGNSYGGNSGYGNHYGLGSSSAWD